MSTRNFTRTVSLFLAFGLFFIGCSSPNPFIEDTKEHLGNENLRQALQSANSGVNNEPKNPEMHYYKGLVHHQMAVSQNSASEKKDHFEAMVNSFSKAFEIYEETGTRGRRARDIEYLVNSSWTEEHNTAAAILKDEGTPSHTQLRQAVDHLRNAVIIQPDSALSYELLAEAFIQLDDPQQALEAMTKAVDLREFDGSHKNYERLAFLALSTGNYELATEAYEKIPQDRMDNKHVAHGLINIYQRDEKPEKVVPIVQRLLASDSEKVEYRIILASQLHKLSIRNYQLWIDKFNAEATTQFENHPDVLEAREYERASIHEYELLIEENPGRYDLIGNLGIILQNTFFIKEEISLLLPDEALSSDLQEEASNQLTTAIIMLEDASDNVESPYLYWETLIQIFTHTGDQEKADRYINLLESTL